MTGIFELLRPFTNLLILTAVLIVPLVVTAAAGALKRRRLPNFRRPAAIGMALFLCMTASAHFTNTEQLVGMLPGLVPMRIELIYLTGILELLLAAAIVFPPTTRVAGFAIAAMLIAFLPANIYAAVNHLPFGGNEQGPAYLFFRIPYQILVVLWSLWLSGWIYGRDGMSPSSMKP